MIKPALIFLIFVFCQPIYAEEKGLSVCAKALKAVDEVSESQLIHLSDKPLGSGKFHEAIEVTYKGKKKIFIKSNASIANSKLSAKEIEAINNLTLEAAQKEAIAFYRSNTDVSSEQPSALSQIAQDMADIALTNEASNLTYRGRALATKASSIVRDEKTLMAGYLVDEVPGTKLFTLTRERGLTLADLNSIDKEVRAQLRILNSKGLVHGDLSEKNILVEMTRSGPVVHFIDYNYGWGQYKKSIGRTDEMKWHEVYMQEREIIEKRIRGR